MLADTNHPFQKKLGSDLKWKKVKNKAASEDSGDPVELKNLARAFAARKYEVLKMIYASTKGMI